MKAKKGNIVEVISGKDTGKKGKVLRVFPRENRVVVEGINLFKRRKRSRKEGEKGQVVSLPMPLHISNVRSVGGEKTESKKK